MTSLPAVRVSPTLGGARDEVNEMKLSVSGYRHETPVTILAPASQDERDLAERYPQGWSQRNRLPVVQAPKEDE